MDSGKKYLRRLDIDLILEYDPIFLEVVRPFLDQAGYPYEVLDAHPKEADTENAEENTSPRRRR